MQIELHIWILARASTKEKSHHSRDGVFLVLVSLSAALSWVLLARKGEWQQIGEKEARGVRNFARKRSKQLENGNKA